MYLRAVHAELDIPSLRNFIRANPLGILITALQSPNFPTLQCTHIPWILDITDETSKTELGTLRGHLARANPHSKAIVEAVQTNSPTSTSNNNNGSLAEEVTVLFNGPVDAYVTPKFYTSTKPATGKVVPTWNYSAVQIYGRATVFSDSRDERTGSYLERQVGDLTAQAEGSMMIREHKGTGTTTTTTGSNDNPRAWEVGDAPASYIELLKKSIIGIEIRVERLEGKYKMSQEMGKGDREGVVEGFEKLESEAGRVMARTVRERGEVKDGGKVVGAA